MFAVGTPSQALAVVLLALLTFICVGGVVEAVTLDMPGHCTGGGCDVTAECRAASPSPSLPVAILSAANVVVVATTTVALPLGSTSEGLTHRPIAPLAPRSPPVLP
jgi:hypothetical protein